MGWGLGTPGTTLTEMMKKSGLPRGEVAEKLAVSVDTVNNWCRDRSSIRLNQLALLISVLIERGMDPVEVQRLVGNLTTASGLSPKAVSKLLPPARAIQTKLVLFLAPESLTLGNRLLAAGAASYLRHTDIDMLLASTYGSVPDFGHRLADVIIATRPIGIIVSGDIPSELVDSVTDTASERDIQVVFVRDFPFFWEGSPSVRGGHVGISSYEIGREAGRFLIRQGHRKIGYFGPSLNFRNFQDRFLGLKAALDEAQLPLSEGRSFFMPLPGDGHILDSIDNLASWSMLAQEAVLAIQSRSVEAVFAVSDPSSLSMYIALANQGMGMNERDPVVMVGIVGSDWPEQIPGPRIAYIALPLYQMGKEAAKLITLGLANRENVASNIQFPLVNPLKVSSRGSLGS